MTPIMLSGRASGLKGFDALWLLGGKMNHCHGRPASKAVQSRQKVLPPDGDIKRQLWMPMQLSWHMAC